MCVSRVSYTYYIVALPPTIPTSFVPKQPVAAPVRRQASGTNIFMLVAGALLLTSIISALGVFGFEMYLKNARDSKAANLAVAQQSVDITIVENFIRLRNRLSAVEQLLNQHVELSDFFTVLEQRTLQAVRFNDLSVSVNDDRSAEIEMSGVARTFNALAAQSNELASEKRIKRAIFSDITVNENGTVGFTLTAIIDPRLITSAEVLPGISETTEAPASPVPEAPALPPVSATSTPRSATTSPAVGTSTPL